MTGVNGIPTIVIGNSRPSNPSAASPCRSQIIHHSRLVPRRTSNFMQYGKNRQLFESTGGSANKVDLTGCGWLASPRSLPKFGDDLESRLSANAQRSAQDGPPFDE